MHGILVHLMPEDIKAFKQLSTQSHFSSVRSKIRQLFKYILVLRHLTLKHIQRENKSMLKNNVFLLLTFVKGTNTR